MTGSIEFVKKRKVNDNVYRILVPVRSVKSIIGPVSSLVLFLIIFMILSYSTSNCQCN